ncbi:MAG: cyclic nucleotide-binding domain-containing protein [Proteobacteria bacterium]|nr:cyclic nucleotide-binding domain-containing protein [Pseudomonadota bacterium]
MSISKLGLTTEQLHGIPLLRALSAEQLQRLVGLFRRRELTTGELLFKAGQTADAMYLLTDGELVLRQGDEETHRLRPPAIIGELGALTGLPRTSTALVGTDAVLWQIDAPALRAFVDAEPTAGLELMRVLLELTVDKISRDQTRLGDMRENIIRTQKAMKRMRDFLLESQDTVVSSPIHEIIEGLIRQNRRVNYRVAPPPTLMAQWRFDDGGEAPIVEVSRTHISYTREPGDALAPGARISAVLALSGPEIPVSGKVLRTIGRRVDVELDLLIDEYAATLEGYLTRVQMLDFLV